MTRNKAKQIEEVKSLANVFSVWESGDFDVGGMREKVRGYFNNGEREGGQEFSLPLILELGCGEGFYTLALAEKFPEKNFVGVDKKGDRIWRGAKRALGAEMRVGSSGEMQEESLRNVAFMQAPIEKLDEIFEPSAVDEIWITFPDPKPKPCNANQRLISPRFLEVYRKICKPEAVVHLKTDNLAFFEFALETVKEAGLEIFEETRDVHGKKNVPELLQILTNYEKRFMGMGVPINYLKFKCRSY